MRTKIMTMFSKLGRVALIGAVTASGLAVPAQATTRHHYHHKTRYHHTCRYSSGGTGLLVGGVAGAVAGPSIVGHGLLGAAAGAVGGAVAGRAIDRTISAPHRCRR